MDARARYEDARRRDRGYERDYDRARGYYEREREREPQRQIRQEGIPLVRPSRPYERRDADGGYGDAPSARPRFEDWTEPDPRRREYECEYETMDAGGGYGYA